ncbi:MAG TPA: Rid family detoxifying hydrolase [Chitinophagaceae bacterium]|jgi:reactive intermediate/imine deaminase|nr:Rid family detoxifying hydrolase [Chitinophagaceae bacterium]
MRTSFHFLFFCLLSFTSRAQSPAAAPPFSKAVLHHGMVFISGQVGVDPKTGQLVKGSFEREVHQVMYNIGTILKSVQLDYSDLVNVTVYLKDMQQYAVFNAVYAAYFKGRLPARVCLAVNDLPSGARLEVAAIAGLPASPKEVVAGFLREVRSGLHPEKARHYFADTVLAHQVNSENPGVVQRTPANYTAHVREFLHLFGPFEFTVTELLADGDRVYARWVQKGIHQADIDDYKATGLPLVEYTSAVYRVEKGKIVEYWLQSDRKGMEDQLKRNAAIAAVPEN